LAQEMAIPGTHKWVMEVLLKNIDLSRQKFILDIGAGQGSLSARLKAAGFVVSACDITPEQFSVPDVEFRKCDESGILPFPDEYFDMAVAVEVLEHIDGHDRFFAEAARILKWNGLLIFTTPNILSLKSRLRFLLTGCFYSFEPLRPFTKNPVVQHISPFTLNRYEWMLSQHDFHICHIETDRIQRSSLLLSLIVPFIMASNFLKFQGNSFFRKQNSTRVLFGRKLLIIAKKRT